MGWGAAIGAGLGALGSMSDKNKGNTSTTTTTETPFQQDQMNNLLGQADSWLGSGGLGDQPNYTSQMGKTLTQMGNHYQGLIDGAGSGKRYAALKSLNESSAEQSANALGGELNAIGMGMGASGAGNSSRAGIAQGIATGEANRDLASLQAQQNQDFLTNEQKLQQQGAVGMNQLFGNIGSLQDIAQANTPEAQRLKELMAYQQMISGNMGGTSTSSGSSNDGSGNNMFNSILGGASAGASISDKKLKKNIKKTKVKNKKIKTKDGVDVAKWEWNKKAQDKHGLKGSSVGVIAQEAKKKKPKAVKKDPKSNDWMVEYGKL